MRRLSRIVVVGASIAAVAVLASSTESSAQPQPSSVAPLQQQQQRVYEIALDTDGDQHPDDCDSDGTPDRYVDAAFTCLTSCGLYISTATKACAIFGPVVYFCAGLAVYKCIRTCQTSFEHVDQCQ